MIVCFDECSLYALTRASFSVQMDETVVNGAQLFYSQQFGIDGGGNNTWILGLVNSAPYVSSLFA
jgi:hypothetical protein